MIIDNVDDAQFFRRPTAQETDDTAKERIRKEYLASYIPQYAHGSILIKTRNKQVSSELTFGQAPIEVCKMEDSECLELLGSLYGNSREETENLNALASRLEHLPLALVQAAAFMPQNVVTVHDYLQMLDGSDQELVETLSAEFQTVGHDAEKPNAVAETWFLSFEQLKLMCFFDRQAIPRDFLSGRLLTPQDPPQSQGVLSTTKASGMLKALCMVTEDQNGNFNMHRLVQLITRKWSLYRQAEEAAPQAESLSRATQKPEDPCTILTMNHLTLTYSEQGRFDEAEAMESQALETQKTICGPDDPMTLDSMSTLAKIYSQLRRLDEAEALDLQVFDKWKVVLGHEHP
ncbi:hypothetical protein F4780DRAFT_787060 [Xylariomycetidae sp. FL0641]|nr:hypothetical protein F4780DRAFT_787060 [Xylariomycetidae sp. FL0641]